MEMLFLKVNIYGKRNSIVNKEGRTKEYDKNGNLIFEGEYKNGKRWEGIGKIYDNIRHLLLFEVEYKNGYIKRNYLEKNSTFIGEYKNKKMWNGRGKVFCSEIKSLYEGEFKNGKKQMEKYINMKV